MRSILVAGSSQRRRASAPPSGAVTFDAVSAPRAVFEGSSIETTSWSIASGSNRYLLAFVASAGFGPVASPTPVTHSGSGGTALTALLSDFVPSGHNFTSARAFGLASPTTGAGTTYAVGSAMLKGLVGLSYSGVSGVGDVQTNSAVDSGTSGTISVTLSTPNTSDVCVAFAWNLSNNPTPAFSVGTGVTDRGGAMDPEVNLFNFRVGERARTGSTTSLSFNYSGSDFYNVGIIGVVLQAA